MKQTSALLFLTLILVCGTGRAEVPLMSSDELKDESTHVVLGKVRAVYSTTQKTREWENTNWVAEIAVVNVEKGAGINLGDVIYAHYWNKKWIGKGDPDPHSSGHGGVSKGDFARAHLKRKDGTYHVLLPNGFAVLEPNVVEEASAKLKTSEAAEKELAKVQGKWFRTVKTDGGTFKIIKEHKGNKTTLAVMDLWGRVVEEKNSEFRLEKIGKVRVFTFFNNFFTAGPNKGRTDNAPHSYIYRVTGDTFVEVHGLLVGDDAEPVAFTWERVKE